MVRIAPARLTLIAFLAIIVLGGFNGVAVRFSNRELTPFWGAALRFGIAGIILFAIVAIRRVPLPRGPALTGSVLYGLVGFAGAFGLIYWALVQAPASVGQVILALVPLLTLVLAIAQGLERFHWQSVVGGLVALLGIGIVFVDRLGASLPIASLLAIVIAAGCMAESNVIAKRFPKCHPVANNAIAMGIAAVVLLGVSLVAGEARALPSTAQTLAAVGYVSTFGSVAVFTLFLYVVERWTASATSYAMLLMPLVTVVAAATLANESVTPAFLAGGAVVLAGVYIGAFAPALHHRLARRSARAAPERPSVVMPGCA